MKKKDQLEKTISRLDESAKKIIQTRGYTRDVSKLKALEEMIKEQLVNEDPSHSARTTR